MIKNSVSTQRYMWLFSHFQVLETYLAFCETVHQNFERQIDVISNEMLPKTSHDTRDCLRRLEAEMARISADKLLIDLKNRGETILKSVDENYCQTSTV